MKRLLLIGTLFGVLLLASGAESPAKAGVRFGLFYNSLSSYGEWVDCSYGNVWRPLHMEHAWRPYLYGRWVWTNDYGWYWVSDEPFGWATFHYGRWVYDDFYGWVWAPDDVWGPAWVEWRYSDDYIGWAPLTPSARWNVSFGISFDAGWSTPVHYWNFVPCRSFTHTRIVDYVQPVERTRRFFGSTRGVRSNEANGDRIVNRGVDVNFVERRTQRRVERTEVVNRTSGEGERMVRTDGRQRLEVYRPRIEAPRENDNRNTGNDREMRGGRDRSGTPQGGVRQGGVRVEIQRGTEPRTDVNRRENTQRTQRVDVPNRRYEVQRNNELRREAWQQQKQESRDNRRVDVQRTPQVQPPPAQRETPRREFRTDQQTPRVQPPVQREPQRREFRTDQQTQVQRPERKETPRREFRTEVQPRVQGQPEQQERKQAEQPRTRGRRP